MLSQVTATVLCIAICTIKFCNHGCMCCTMTSMNQEVIDCLMDTTSNKACMSCTERCCSSCQMMIYTCISSDTWGTMGVGCERSKIPNALRPGPDAWQPVTNIQNQTYVHDISVQMAVQRAMVPCLEPIPKRIQNQKLHSLCTINYGIYKSD